MKVINFRGSDKLNGTEEPVNFSQELVIQKTNNYLEIPFFKIYTRILQTM